MRWGRVVPAFGIGLVLAGCSDVEEARLRARESALLVQTMVDLAPILQEIPVVTSAGAADELAVGLRELPVTDPSCITTSVSGDDVGLTFSQCVVATSGESLDGQMTFEGLIGDGRSAAYEMQLGPLILEGRSMELGARFRVGEAKAWTLDAVGGIDRGQQEVGGLFYVEGGPLRPDACMDLDVGAELNAAGSTSMAAKATGCPGRCPVGGKVGLSWDRGTSAEFGYNGDQVVVLRIAGTDEMVDFRLPCINP